MLDGRGCHDWPSYFWGELTRTESLADFEPIENFDYHFEHANAAFEEMGKCAEGSAAYNQYKRAVVAHVDKAERAIPYLRRKRGDHAADDAETRLERFASHLNENHGFQIQGRS